MYVYRINISKSKIKIGNSIIIFINTKLLNRYLTMNSQEFNSYSVGTNYRDFIIPAVIFSIYQKKYSTSNDSLNTTNLLSLFICPTGIKGLKIFFLLRKFRQSYRFS